MSSRNSFINLVEHLDLTTSFDDELYKVEQLMLQMWKDKLKQTI